MVQLVFYAFLKGGNAILVVRDDHIKVFFFVVVVCQISAHECFKGVHVLLVLRHGCDSMC